MRDDPGFWWSARFYARQVRWWLVPLVMFFLAWLIWAWLGYPR